MYAFPNRTCVRSISGAGSPISGRIIFINAAPESMRAVGQGGVLLCVMFACSAAAYDPIGGPPIQSAMVSDHTAMWS